MADGPGIPAFDENGNLPPGVHPATLQEMEARFTWTGTRQRLCQGLKGALASLVAAGVRRLWIDGGFVTAKDEPADVDGCWEYHAAVDVEKLDPVFLDLSPPREAMRMKYGVDFLIAHARVGDAPNRTVVEFFQVDREGNRKGIVLLEIGDQR